MFRHPDGRDMTYREVWQECREMWETLKEVFPPRVLATITGVALSVYVLVSIFGH